jgi:uncharacterized protein
VRIVFDTNVLIAAFISQGVCHELFEHCILHHSLIGSDFILAEVKEKLVRKFIVGDEGANEAEKFLRSSMEIVAISNLQNPVCRDPDDDNILATAVAGSCECIITGDKDLLILREYAGIRIISPAEFSLTEEE